MLDTLPEKNEENSDEKPREKPKVSIEEDSPLIFTDKMLQDDNDFEELYRKFPLTEDTTCGLGFLRGEFMQM